MGSTKEVHRGYGEGETFKASGNFPDFTHSIRAKSDEPCTETDVRKIGKSSGQRNYAWLHNPSFKNIESAKTLNESYMERVLSLHLQGNNLTDLSWKLLVQLLIYIRATVTTIYAILIIVQSITAAVSIASLSLSLSHTHTHTHTHAHTYTCVYIFIIQHCHSFFTSAGANPGTNSL